MAIINDLIFAYVQGGMAEFSRTGVYPRYYQFESESLNRIWRLKGLSRTRRGVLRLKGKVIFNFVIKNGECKVQQVIDGIPDAEWIDVPFCLTQAD